jgi:hypothetical protein
MSQTDEDKQWFGQQLDQRDRKLEQMSRKLERIEMTVLAEARRRAVAAAIDASDFVPYTPGHVRSSL